MLTLVINADTNVATVQRNTCKKQTKWKNWPVDENIQRKIALNMVRLHNGNFDFHYCYNDKPTLTLEEVIYSSMDQLAVVCNVI